MRRLGREGRRVSHDRGEDVKVRVRIATKDSSGCVFLLMNHPVAVVNSRDTYESRKNIEI